MLKKNTRKIKAILFDLGKVILHFNFEPAFKRLAKHSTMSAKDIEDYFVMSGLEVLYDGGKISTREFFREVKKALHLSIGFEHFKKIWNEIFTPNPSIIRLVRRLDGKYPLVLISNTNAMHFAYLAKTCSVLKLFDHHILSFKEKSRKPDPRIYWKAVRACGAKPSEIFYIDDREDLTAAAQEMGFETFTYKCNTPQLLDRMKALRIL